MPGVEEGALSIEFEYDTVKVIALSVAAAIALVAMFTAGYLVGYAAGERDRVDRDP